MNRRLNWLVLIGAAVVLAGSASLLLRSRHASGQTVPDSSSVPVTTTLVAGGDVPIEQEAIGRVTALNTVTIRPQVGGQVTAIKFKDGQFVQQGDVLVEIDPGPLRATVAEDKAALARDRARLASAATDLERYVPLLAQGVVSAQQVSDQRAQVAQLRAAVAADQAVLARNQIQLGYTTITAPISGVLGLTMIDVGNVLDPVSPAGVVVLTRIQPITVLFPVPQASLTEVRERQTASTRGLLVEAWSQDGARQLDQGVLSAVSNEVDATTGTVMLKAVFSNPKSLLWPGASVAVRLVLDVRHDGLTIPAAAVNQGPKGPFAWTVARDGTARMAQITIAQQLRGQVLVSSGLSAGERVVTDGQYGLTSGAHVKIQNPAEQAYAVREQSPEFRTIQSGRLGISP
jgi:membrane fusion protein, multidrug efflux system